MCRNVNTYFAFSFGGNADFGESQFVNTSLTIDFPEEKELIPGYIWFGVSLCCLTKSVIAITNII